MDGLSNVTLLASEAEPASTITRREFLEISAATGALTVLPGQHSSAAAKESSSALPPMRGLPVNGVHVYTDLTSYRAGETVRLHTSAKLPHRLEIVRHDRAVQDAVEDTVLYTWQVDEPLMQPVYAGSYIHVKKGIEKEKRPGLTLECWVRLWNVHEPQGIITQLNDGAGFGLLVFPDGTLGFFTGDTNDPAMTTHRIETALSLPDNTARNDFMVPPARWHHVVAVGGGGKRAIWVDGRRAGEWDHPKPFTFAGVPLRIGAFGRGGKACAFLDADIAMPVVYGRSLSDIEIKTRYAERGRVAPELNESVLGCWPLEEEGGEIISDASSQGRRGRLVNHGTWMIGGPSFLPVIARYKTDYDPAKDATRGHGLRLASDDLYDCRWKTTHEFKLPKDAAPGLYSARAAFLQDGEEVTTHAVFVVRRARHTQRAPIAFLFATNTFKAYSGAPFSPAWAGATNVGIKGYRPDKKDPLAAFCFYRHHRAGQPTYQLGWRMPWPTASPYAIYSPPEAGYAHGSASNLWSVSWLKDNGYATDALSDYDLQADPQALDGAKVLFIAGHNEYWSREAMQRVRAFLDRGGKVVCLSGNTMYWRVSFSDDGHVVECRKADAWGAQLFSYMRGECWHAHDKRRGGVPRDCGDPAWATIGVEFAGACGHMGANGEGAFHVTDARHPFFTGPEPTELTNGDRFGFDPDNPKVHPIGHESDVRVSNLMEMTRRMPTLRGLVTDLKDPTGIQLLAEGRLDADGTNGSYRDYAHRVIPQSSRKPDDSLCDVIHWRRPGGGEVFAAPTIAAGWTLGACPKWTTLMKNVLYHFGVNRGP